MKAIPVAAFVNAWKFTKSELNELDQIVRSEREKHVRTTSKWWASVYEKGTKEEDD